MNLDFRERRSQKKTARTVTCSCREASDATCVSQVIVTEIISRAITHACR